MNLIALAAGLLSGIIGAMGLGGGAVLIIYLSVFTNTEQMTAQGINLLFFIPTAICAVTVYAVKKQIKWKLTLKIAAWGVVGVFSGLALADVLGGNITSKLFGTLLIVMGIPGLFAKTKNGGQK